VALLPEQFAGTSRTVGVPLQAGGAERVVGLTWRTDRAQAPPAARFLDFLRRAGPFD
jgi:DNA-binding transcriptional LysR family regulator